MFYWSYIISCITQWVGVAWGEITLLPESIEAEAKKPPFQPQEGSYNISSLIFAVLNLDDLGILVLWQPCSGDGLAAWDSKNPMDYTPSLMAPFD